MELEHYGERQSETADYNPNAQKHVDRQAGLSAANGLVCSRHRQMGQQRASSRDANLAAAG